ncbi:MAG: helix-turn-helix transcriptional regulator [Candidatus Dormibacteraeota bacterium]|nr:helix-turn-helix transcriptional regulator [Candidatus Dormibacteraeota bacterium]
MGGSWALQAAGIDLVRLAHAGLDSRALRTQFLDRLSRLIAFDSAWFAMADPATLLFTDAVRQEIPPDSTPRFVEDEFLLDDYNKWVDLAHAPVHANSLELAAAGDLQASYRFREILKPLGLGDELRAALVSGRLCWGFICLHRELGGRNFSSEERGWLASLAPAMADGLRASLLLQAAGASTDEAGVVLLAADLSVSGMSPQAERWLAEISDEDWPSARELPSVILGVAARLRAQESAGQSLRPASARIRTRSGVWLLARASNLTGEASAGQTAVVLAPARPFELAEVIMDAYGLTPREQQLTGLVLQGLSTKELGAHLLISESTVQQHLKSIFDKVGVRSRRELAAQVFAAQYQPRIREGLGVGASGWFSQ